MDISDLAGLHREVEEITADLDVWAGRQEPDSRARRYGSAAVSAIDAALAELQQIRARLIAELGDADKAVMADAQPPAEIAQAFRESRRGVASCAPMPERPARPAPRTALDSRGVTRYGWSPPPALEGYGYVLPEDYMRGGAQ